MSADLKDKNKESIDCAMKAIYKMKEKREWAENEVRPIVAAVCEPFIERAEYKRRNKRYFY